MDITNVAFWLKIVSVIMLAGFLPHTAVGYYYFRREQKKIEVERILSILRNGRNFWLFSKQI